LLPHDVFIFFIFFKFSLKGLTAPLQKPPRSGVGNSSYDYRKALISRYCKRKTVQVWKWKQVLQCSHAWGILEATFLLKAWLVKSAQRDAAEMQAYTSAEHSTREQESSSHEPTVPFYSSSSSEVGSALNGRPSYSA